MISPSGHLESPSCPMKCLSGTEPLMPFPQYLPEAHSSHSPLTLPTPRYTQSLRTQYSYQ